MCITWCTGSSIDGDPALALCGTSHSVSTAPTHVHQRFNVRCRLALKLVALQCDLDSLDLESAEGQLNVVSPNIVLDLELLQLVLEKIRERCARDVRTRMASETKVRTSVPAIRLEQAQHDCRVALARGEGRRAERVVLAALNRLQEDVWRKTEAKRRASERIRDRFGIAWDVAHCAKVHHLSVRKEEQERRTVDGRIEEVGGNRDVRLEEAANVGHDGPRELMLAYEQCEM
jgi:hypothetical protein